MVLGWPGGIESLSTWGELPLNHLVEAKLFVFYHEIGEI
jgi:hypothetical protein